MIDSIVNSQRLTINLSGNLSDKIKKSEIVALELMLDSTEFNEFIINLDEIDKFDMSFIIFLKYYIDKIKSKNKQINIIANTQNAKKILEFLENVDISKEDSKIKENYIKQSISKLGANIADAIHAAIDFINFIGILQYYLFLSITNPKKIKFRAISYHIYHGVLTAMPIIFVVSFIVGGVIAYQGAATLQRMGFPQASVEMTAKLTLREIGPFVVALIVAGRSASSYTAQIGVMKMTEEISAMKTMNFNLLNFIVLPRFIALVVSFPLMVFLSDLVSIFGCMIFLKAGFNISFNDYISQFIEFVEINSFWTGIIKAPFYAAVIAIVGCFVGFRVKNSTQSVGEKTTASVVYALFGVILVNAIFSLIFTELRF
ncbi:ABC transporter permease [Helicobacter sp. MIT 99-5507]|uniref:MlaE family ABC transporter permease n=1 Tax=Helicobacter sp. MIT 99-5507 TaxID=152489 RepID=UPI000E1E7AA6|nr:ABC transporter permease [Helicobacter sp. MIT 99-5507]RDU58075.1 ABC transporter [Helicobacter sp. MIT 99-5507]